MLTQAGRLPQTPRCENEVALAPQECYLPWTPSPSRSHPEQEILGPRATQLPPVGLQPSPSGRDP